MTFSFFKWLRKWRQARRDDDLIQKRSIKLQLANLDLENKHYFLLLKEAHRRRLLEREIRKRKNSFVI